jgi:outer membrane receptor protein involved in Fe transport
MAAAMAAWVVVAFAAPAAEPDAPLGATIATVRDRSGWSASLLVAPPERRSFLEDPAIRTTPPVVNATVSRPLTKSSRLSFDVTNVFDRQAPGGQFLEAPLNSRGFGVRLRIGF